MAKVAGGANVLLLVPPKKWPSVDRDFSFPLNGGSISYRHEPKIDWTLASGWNHPALKELVSEVLGRARLSRALEARTRTGEGQPQDGKTFARDGKPA